MAEEDQDDSTDELDGLTEDDAKRLLEEPKGDDPDPDGADKLGDAGRRALDSMKEQRRAAREERDKVKSELDKVSAELRKHSDRDKSETQRLQEERDSLKTELETARSGMRRREVAEEHAPEHATPAQIRAVAKRLAGSTDEELKADAEELYALIAPAPATRQQSVPGKPKERLRGGGAPDDGPGEMDPKALAALIPRAR